MTETDVRNALGRATDHLSAPPDLLDRVRAGGRRRQVRRRTVLGAGLAVAGAGALLPSVVGRHHGPVTGGDRDFLDRALAAWKSAVGRDAFGRPTVHWSGDTPAGPVALISQRTAERGAVTEGDGFEVFGFVEQLGDEVRPAGEARVVQAGTVPVLAMLAGRSRDTLLVSGDSAAVQLSDDYAIDRDGKVARVWAGLGASAGGMTVRSVADQTQGIRIALRNADQPIPLTNLGQVQPVRPGLENQGPEQIERRLPGWDKAWSVTQMLSPSELDRWSVFGKPAYADSYGYHSWDGTPPWSLRGGLPDGRRLVVQTLVLDGMARVFWFAGRSDQPPRPHYAGPLDSASSTEVLDEANGPLRILHVRLPGRLGVVVAAYQGKLAYRVKTGDWLTVTGDAALLPDAATELRVRPWRGKEVTVGLP